MAKQFLLRERVEGAQRHLEVHALTEADGGGEPAVVPVMKVVDVTSGLREFSDVRLPGYAISPNYDGDSVDDEAVPDVVLPALDAAAAVLAFFSRVPDSSMFYFVPDETIQHLPKEFIVGLPDLIAGEIQKTMLQTELDVVLEPYNPDGLYL